MSSSALLISSPEEAAPSKLSTTHQKGRFIYLMKNSLGLYKIGISADVKRRRREIQNSSGVPVEIINVWFSDHAFRDESYVHRDLTANRKNGEWFQIDDEPEKIVDMALSRARIAREIEGEARNSRSEEDESRRAEAARKAREKEEEPLERYRLRIEKDENDKALKEARKNDKARIIEIIASYFSRNEDGTDEWWEAVAFALRIGVKPWFLVRYDFIHEHLRSDFYDLAERIELDLAEKGDSYTWPEHYPRG